LSDKHPSLAYVTPALEHIYQKWNEHLDAKKWPRFQRFVPALTAGFDMIEKYYNKTEQTDAYILAQGMFYH
jgi:hypothetical protein